MSDGLSAATGAPGTASGPVFRSELNPVNFLYRAAYIYPDKTAVVSGRQRYSYRQLAERSWRLAGALRSAGLRKEDRVATLLFNSPAMLEAHFGVPAAGGSWSRSTTGCPAPRSATSSVTAARATCWLTANWKR